MSIDFYNQHAAQFFSSTVDIDASSLLKPFLDYLPDGGYILDAGCGSGRDSKHLIELGYQVQAFDASPALAALAQTLIKQPVTVATFLEWQTDQHFDGIWACASLLHVPRPLLTQTFAHLALMLKTEGAFYCSFKYGQDEVTRDGRSFTNCDESLLCALLSDVPLNIEKLWITQDLRAGRETEQWLNAILLKA